MSTSTSFRPLQPVQVLNSARRHPSLQPAAQIKSVHPLGIGPVVTTTGNLSNLVNFGPVSHTSTTLNSGTDNRTSKNSTVTSNTSYASQGLSLGPQQSHVTVSDCIPNNYISSKQLQKQQVQPQQLVRAVPRESFVPSNPSMPNSECKEYRYSDHTGPSNPGPGQQLVNLVESVGQSCDGQQTQFSSSHESSAGVSKVPSEMSNFGTNHEPDVPFGFKFSGRQTRDFEGMVDMVRQQIGAFEDDLKDISPVQGVNLHCLQPSDTEIKFGISRSPSMKLNRRASNPKLAAALPVEGSANGGTFSELGRNLVKSPNLSRRMASPVRHRAALSPSPSRNASAIDLRNNQILQSPAGVRLGMPGPIMNSPSRRGLGVPVPGGTAMERSVSPRIHRVVSTRVGEVVNGAVGPGGYVNTNLVNSMSLNGAVATSMVRTYSNTTRRIPLSEDKSTSGDPDREPLGSSGKSPPLGRGYDHTSSGQHGNLSVNSRISARIPGAGNIGINGHASSSHVNPGGDCATNNYLNKLPTPNETPSKTNLELEVEEIAAVQLVGRERLSHSAGKGSNCINGASSKASDDGSNGGVGAFLKNIWDGVAGMGSSSSSSARKEEDPTPAKIETFSKETVTIDLLSKSSVNSSQLIQNQDLNFNQNPSYNTASTYSKKSVDSAQSDQQAEAVKYSRANPVNTPNIGGGSADASVSCDSLSGSGLNKPRNIVPPFADVRTPALKLSRNAHNLAVGHVRRLRSLTPTNQTRVVSRDPTPLSVRGPHVGVGFGLLGSRSNSKSNSKPTVIHTTAVNLTRSSFPGPGPTAMNSCISAEMAARLEAEVQAKVRAKKAEMNAKAAAYSNRTKNQGGNSNSNAATPTNSVSVTVKANNNSTSTDNREPMLMAAEVHREERKSNTSSNTSDSVSRRSAQLGPVLLPATVASLPRESLTGPITTISARMRSVSPMGTLIPPQRIYTPRQCLVTPRLLSNAISTRTTIGSARPSKESVVSAVTAPPGPNGTLQVPRTSRSVTPTVTVRRRDVTPPVIINNMSGGGTSVTLTPHVTPSILPDFKIAGVNGISGPAVNPLLGTKMCSPTEEDITASNGGNGTIPLAMRHSNPLGLMKHQARTVEKELSELMDLMSSTGRRSRSGFSSNLSVVTGGVCSTKMNSELNQAHNNYLSSVNTGLDVVRALSNPRVTVQGTSANDGNITHRTVTPGVSVTKNSSCSVNSTSKSNSGRVSRTSNSNGALSQAVVSGSQIHPLGSMFSHSDYVSTAANRAPSNNTYNTVMSRLSNNQNHRVGDVFPLPDSGPLPEGKSPEVQAIFDRLNNTCSIPSKITPRGPGTVGNCLFEDGAQLRTKLLQMKAPPIGPKTNFGATGVTRYMNVNGQNQCNLGTIGTPSGQPQSQSNLVNRASSKTSTNGSLSVTAQAASKTSVVSGGSNLNHNGKFSALERRAIKGTALIGQRSGNSNSINSNTSNSREVAAHSNTTNINAHNQNPNYGSKNTTESDEIQKTVAPSASATAAAQAINSNTNRSKNCGSSDGVVIEYESAGNRDTANDIDDNVSDHITHSISMSQQFIQRALLSGSRTELPNCNDSGSGSAADEDFVPTRLSVHTADELGFQSTVPLVNSDGTILRGTNSNNSNPSNLSNPNQISNLAVNVSATSILTICPEASSSNLQCQTQATTVNSEANNLNLSEAEINFQNVQKPNASFSPPPRSSRRPSQINEQVLEITGGAPLVTNSASNSKNAAALGPMTTSNNHISSNNMSTMTQTSQVLDFTPNIGGSNFHNGNHVNDPNSNRRNSVERYRDESGERNYPLTELSLIQNCSPAFQNSGSNSMNLNGVSGNNSNFLGTSENFPAPRLIHSPLGVVNEGDNSLKLSGDLVLSENQDYQYNVCNTQNYNQNLQKFDSNQNSNSAAYGPSSRYSDPRASPPRFHLQPKLLPGIPTQRPS